MIYACCDERRRAYVRDHGVVDGVDYNGIDFLEVLDTLAPAQKDRQRKLFVHFLKNVTGIDEHNVAITGGERITGIRVLKARVEAGDPLNVLTVEVDRPGDYSTYTLRILEDALHPEGDPPDAIDPVLSTIEFSFKVECPSDFDCRTDHVCPPEERDTPEIDYLAKDYNSFRQVMLDRMSVLVPQWQERNAADVGITLVELLAYAADHLSYQQDVIATEAYLHTARRRVSARRHAALVDYSMHDGCNARTWVQITTNADNVKVERGTKLLTRVDGLDFVADPEHDVEARLKIAEAHPDVFETVEDVMLFSRHETLPFYTWGNERCCLPTGATRATLDGSFPDLHPGDVLVFVEKKGPVTGAEADADATHRHAVRLIATKLSRDRVYKRDLTEIEWHADDALPFPLCISSDVEEHGLETNVSVALGNIVLADHGNTIREDLDDVPAAVDALATIASRGGDRCSTDDAELTPPRYRPRLKEGPLTQVAPRPFAIDPKASASSVYRWEMRDVLPAIEIEDAIEQLWHPQRDLLASDAFRREFVAEVEENGRATLRFGDDVYGRRPTPESKMTARYRMGNGTHGNIGAESLAHILTGDGAITGVSNPMPARGGIDPESIEHVRQSAPSAFRTQERAVTTDDYAEVSERYAEVQQAAATRRWTGSWHTMFLTVDRLGGRTVDAAFERNLRLHVERYRMAGHDVEVDGPHFVPLEIEMTICIQANYYRGDVRAAVMRVLSNSISPSGERGIFHPDNFTFGQPVYLSAIYAAVQKVEGVRHLTITKFQRLGIDSTSAIDEGVLKIDRLEIARLDNDPNFVERGVLRLTLEGGK